MGNKCDLCHLRQVTHEDTRDMQQRLQCPVLETSASESYQSVLEAFSLLIDIYLRNGKRRKIGTSRIAHLKETLLSLTSYRNRTNTF